MVDLLSEPVLVLNRNFEAIEVTNVRRALVLMYCGAAHAFDEGELYDFSAWRAVHPSSHEPNIPIIGGLLRVPRVVHLTRYDLRPRAAIRLTRRNLMFRDQFQCQYCGLSPGPHDLNIDHVFPRSRGGAASWENLVTSCRTCNLRKGGRTPEEANMRLAKRPMKPRWSVVTQILLRHSEPYREWEPFLKAS